MKGFGSQSSSEVSHVWKRKPAGELGPPTMADFHPDAIEILRVWATPDVDR
jgi:hypothetical protein